DLQEFVTCLPHDSESLDVLVVRCEKYNPGSPIVKANNIYHRDISINDNVLQPLLENDSIFEQLPWLTENENQDEQNIVINEADNKLNKDEFILQTFVPFLSLGQSKNSAIFNALSWI
ncbi:1879_t:CDS:2, partial [Gigaspora margarita]